MPVLMPLRKGTAVRAVALVAAGVIALSVFGGMAVAELQFQESSTAPPDPGGAVELPSLPLQAVPNQSLTDDSTSSLAASVDLVAQRLREGTVPVRRQVDSMVSATNSSPTQVIANAYTTVTLRPDEYTGLTGFTPQQLLLLREARMLTVGLVTDGGINFVTTDGFTSDFRGILAGAMDSAAEQYRSVKLLEAIRALGPSSNTEEMTAPSGVQSSSPQADDISHARSTIDERMRVLGFDMPLRTFLDNEKDILSAFPVVAIELYPSIGAPPFQAPDAARIIHEATG